MKAELAYSEFIRRHVKSRQGEARRRLTEGLGHAEMLFLQQVWWPAFSNFDNQVPQSIFYDPLYAQSPSKRCKTSMQQPPSYRNLNLMMKYIIAANEATQKVAEDV